MTWMTLLYLFGGYWLYRIIVTAIENERITKVAKIEARLKQELSQRYADPMAVERIMGARLHDPSQLRHRAEHEHGGAGFAEHRTAQMQQAGEYFEARNEAERAKSRDGHMLGGLITFLLGGAFCLSAYIVHIDPLYIPGLLLAAIGLALLTFATSQQEIAKAAQSSHPSRQES
jgi:hypothetical protein